MSFLKDINTSIKHAKDIQKGMKDLGFGFGKKSGDKASEKSVSQDAAVSPTASTTSPSIAPSTSTTAFTPGTTPAASKAESVVQADKPSVPVCQKEGAPTKIPLTARKTIRDEFESKKGELEQEFSKILGTPWTLYVDAVGVYSYTKNNDSGGAVNPGGFFHSYFRGALEHLQSFKEAGYTAEELASINNFAPQHIITLEPTTDETVQYGATDFFEGRWRILFRDTMFGVNIKKSCEKLAEVINSAEKTGEGAAKPEAPALSLKARKDIRDRYDPEIEAQLSKARKLLAMPALEFIPNFETNYATLAAFAATQDPEEYRPELRHDWETTMGGATLEYFGGFASQLDWQKFKGDEMMQEGFQEVVTTNKVAFLVTKTLTKNYCDCVLEDGMLVIRCTPQTWWSGVDRACEKLSDML